MSSIVDGGIKTILNLFYLFIYFSQEDFRRTKSTKNVKSIKSTKSLKTTKSTKRKQATFTQTFLMRIKSIKSTKSTKRQTSDFLLLDVFMHIKMLPFFTHKKAHKKHKNANKRIGDFFPLRCVF